MLRFMVSFAGAHVCPRGSISVYRTTGKSWRKSNPNLFLLLRCWVSWLLNGLVCMMTLSCLYAVTIGSVAPPCPSLPSFVISQRCFISIFIFLFSFLQPKRHLNTSSKITTLIRNDILQFFPFSHQNQLV